MVTKKKWSVILVGILIVVMFVSLTRLSARASEKKSPLPRTLTIATLPRGSANNALGAAIAKVLTTKLGVQATDRPSGGYGRFIPLADRGEMDMAISSANSPYNAITGQFIFKNSPLYNLRVLATANPLMATWAAGKKSGVKTWADMKGKRIAISKTMGGGSGYLRNKVVFKYYGLDIEKDFIQVPIPSFPAGTKALMGGRVDVAYAAVGAPATRETANALGGLNWLFETEEQVDAIRDDLINAGVLPAKLQCFEGLRGMPKKSCFGLGANVFMGNRTLSEEHAYLIVKTLWENIKDIQAAHPAFRLWNREIGFVRPQADQGGIYHPGAIRFYKEVGKWTDEAEKQNQWLIEQMERSKKKHGK